MCVASTAKRRRRQMKLDKRYKKKSGDNASSRAEKPGKKGKK